MLAQLLSVLGSLLSLTPTNGGVSEPHPNFLPYKSCHQIGRLFTINNFQSLSLYFYTLTERISKSR